jgi:hypothetical protein
MFVFFFFSEKYLKFGLGRFWPGKFENYKQKLKNSGQAIFLMFQIFLKPLSTWAPPEAWLS